jgi:hypothetical protein
VDRNPYAPRRASAGTSFCARFRNFLGAPEFLAPSALTSASMDYRKGDREAGWSLLITGQHQSGGDPQRAARGEPGAGTGDDDGNGLVVIAGELPVPAGGQRR